MQKMERDVSEDITSIDEYDMENFGTLHYGERKIGILGERCWLQTAKQEGDNMVICIWWCYIWKKLNERPNIGGVSVWSRNCPPSRKDCGVNGQLATASKK